MASGDLFAQFLCVLSDESGRYRRVGPCIFDAAAQYPVYFPLQWGVEPPRYDDGPERQRQSCESFPFDAEIGYQLQPDFAVDEPAFVDQHARIAFSGHYRLGNVGKEVGTPVFDGRIDFVQQQVGGGVFARDGHPCIVQFVGVNFVTAYQ